MQYHYNYHYVTSMAIISLILSLKEQQKKIPGCENYNELCTVHFMCVYMNIYIYIYIYNVCTYKFKHEFVL